MKPIVLIIILAPSAITLLLLLSQPPIFICHGEEDDVVKKEWGFKAYNDLKHEGFEVEWRSYAHLGHSVSPAELNDISNFLTSNL